MSAQRWRPFSTASTGRIVTGYGIYTDPSSRHIDLLNARKAIDAALSVMNATKWPTNADYDLEENA